MLNFLKQMFGTRNEREIKKLQPMVEMIGEMEAQVSAMTDEELRGETDKFKERLKNGETLDDILPAAFAVVREAGKRALNMRHFDVQLIWNGPAFRQNSGNEDRRRKNPGCHSSGIFKRADRKGVHVITVNDYLRNATVWV